MKKSKIAGLAFAMILACGCGADRLQDATEPLTETEEKARSEVSMYDLRVAMEAADDTLPDMMNASSAEEDAGSNFAHVSDLDYEKVESYFVSYAAEGGKADEIVVIAVRNKDDVRAAEDSLKEHKTKRIRLLEQYEPAEVKRVEDGVVFTSGRYAVLIICDNSSAVRRAFEQAVSGT